MASILIFIMVVSILIFWNIDAYIREKNKFPAVREIFRLHVRKRDYRAYKFFVYFSVMLLCLFAYSIYTSGPFVEWIPSYSKDIVLTMLFLTGLVNYIFRMRVACVLYGKKYSENVIYVWDVWGIAVKDCASLMDKIILFVLNIFIFILVGLFIL